MGYLNGLDEALKALIILAAIGCVAIVAAAGWLLWFLVSHLAWVQ